MSGVFDPPSAKAVVELIDAYPLAWLISDADEEFAATPLPLLAETNADGILVALFGHMALGNPQAAALRQSPRAFILFQGPQGYMSPEPLSNRDWAPTWNYAIARFTVRVEFVPEENDRALQLLLEKMEAGRARPWTPAEMGDRYHSLKRHIVAFRAHILKADAKFKLGQDEQPQTLKQLIGGAQDATLAQWMRRANADRLELQEGWPDRDR
jgi:transcriptional regulator